MGAVSLLREVRYDLVDDCKYIKESDLRDKSKGELIEFIKGRKSFMTSLIIQIDDELEQYY